MNSNEIIIPCRLSYANLFEPKQVNGQGEAKYSTALLIDKDDPIVAKLQKLINQVKNEGAAKWGGKIPANLKMPLRDGDEEKPEDDNYANKFFMNANSSRQPKLIDQRCQPIMDEEELYSGAYANVKVSLFAFNSNGNKGIGCGLVAVQKVKDGEKLAGDSGTEGFTALDDDEADDFDCLG